MSHLTRYFRNRTRRSCLLLVMVFITSILIGAPSASAAANPCDSVTLRAGATGSCVKQLQDALSVRGIPSGRSGSDSAYGAGTKAAVVEYQKLYGLVADGVVGPKTRAVIAANPKPHPKIIARLSSRWSESGTIAIVDKMGTRGSPAVSNVARIYLFRDAKLIRTIQARTGGKAWDPGAKKWVYKNTPTGAFRVQAKFVAGYSDRYEAKMPYFTVFNGDIGFHYSAGFLSTVANGYGYEGTLGSHGCVNIGNMADAILIFNYLTVGRNQVVVQLSR